MQQLCLEQVNACLSNKLYKDIVSSFDKEIVECENKLNDLKRRRVNFLIEQSNSNIVNQKQ